MIRSVQKRYNELDKDKIKTIMGEFSLSKASVRKFVNMTDDEINGMDNPKEYKKRKTVTDDYVNIIYKMLRDRIKPAVIMSYVIRAGYGASQANLESYIKLLAKNNFNIRLCMNWPYVFEYPDDVTVIKRNELLKYITTKNPKVKKDETIERHFGIVKEKYKIIAPLQEAYDEFYELLMGDDPDKLDSYIAKYKESAIGGFIDGISRDIVPVKNAISRDESSGFVEGSNNKFKLIKRILYGRANLTNLFKKSYVAFQVKLKDFNLRKLMLHGGEN